MGCLFVVVLGGLSAGLISMFGYPLWVLIVLGALWLAALILSAVFGHRGFGGREKTDFMIVLAGAVIASAIIVPKYEARTPCILKVPPCTQPELALRKLAEAEDEYFLGHGAYTTRLDLLGVKPDPGIHLMVPNADGNAFIANAICDENGTARVLTWDSAKGRLR